MPTPDTHQDADSAQAAESSRGHAPAAEDDAQAVGAETAGAAPWTPTPGTESVELRPVTFSAKALRHGRNPGNLARLDNPHASASRMGWCGELMEMYLRLEAGRIAQAAFWADGCVSTMACADVITGMVRGLTPEEAGAITPEQLVAALDGLPYASQHCAELSVDTMRDALEDWRRRCDERRPGGAEGGAAPGDADVPAQGQKRD